MRRLLPLLLTLLGAAHAADLKSKLDDLVSNWPALANAFAGLRVVTLNDGRVLYDHDSNRLFVPASNMKLFTTALALQRLGRDYRMVTQICAAKPLDAAGRLAGDLTLVGGGDPSLSGRTYPYSAAKASEGEYSFRALDEMVTQLFAHGLRRVDGDIVGDDRRYIWSPYADGWSFGDALSEYGAPVSALILDDNSFGLTLKPAELPGDPAQLWLSPAFEYFTIDNRVLTTPQGERAIGFDRKPSSRQLHLWGTIPLQDSGLTQLLAVDDPAQYAAEVLREALLRRGIQVRGKALAHHRLADDSGDDTPGATKSRLVLAEHSSPPLGELLQVVDKVSQNLHAEGMLREVGLVRRHLGSREAGLAELQDFLNEIGISKDEYRFTDGSGLSRASLVTPAAITQLLAYMYRTENRDVWMGLLPIAGVDGTLRLRFPDHPEAHAIRAKTGTLSHVRANSGYIDSPIYGPLAFSFLVNNYDAPTADINKFLDAVELALLN